MILNSKLLRIAIVILLSIVGIVNAQTISITLSGNVTDYNHIPQQCDVKVKQLVGITWEDRAEGVSDSLGNFSILLDNVTDIEDAHVLASMNYSLNGSLLFSPHKSVAEINYYDILGRSVFKDKVELLEGENKLSHNLNHLASGIYIRQIKIKEGSITQKISVTGSGLQYGVGVINSLNLNLSKRENLSKTMLDSDSLYIMTIAESVGYSPDTLIVAISKDNPIDITGLKHVLEINNNYIEFEFGWWSVHGLTRKGKTIFFQDQDDTTKTYSFVCNDSNKVNVIIELEEGHSGMFKIYQNDLEDSLMNLSVFENKNTGKNIAANEVNIDIPNSIIESYPYIITNIHKLDSAATADELGFFDLPRFAQTNYYPTNGVHGYIDLQGWTRDMFKRATSRNAKWAPAYGADSVNVIGSTINMNEEEKEVYRNTVQQIINMTNELPNGAWSNMPFTKLKEFDDVNSNPVIDSIAINHNKYNVFRIYKGPGDLGGWKIGENNTGIKNGFSYNQVGTDWITIISEFGAAIAVDDPKPPIYARVGTIWAAQNVTGYNNTPKITEAMYLMFHAVQKAPQNHIIQ